MGDPQKSTVETDVDGEEHFELDLDEHSSEDLNEVIEEAVAAVDLSDRSGKRGAESSDVERLRAENRALRERLMRTLADFDNFRKRTEREKQSLGRFAIFDVVKDFLPVVDNLERALAASGKLEDLKLGLEMVMKQQGDVLERHGVEMVESVGKAFDPTVHQAVTREESEEVAVPMVKTELQRGYLLYDRLLRPAMVTVAVPVAPDEDASAAEDAANEVDMDDRDQARGETDGDEEAVHDEVGQLTD